MTIRSLICFSYLFILFNAFSQEICSNGIDDDGDGLIDCYDYFDCSDSNVCDDFFIGVSEPIDTVCSEQLVSAEFEMEVLWQRNDLYISNINTFFTGDVDNDGNNEVIVLASDSFGNNTEIKILNGRTGQDKKTIIIENNIPDNNNRRISFADVNHDGFAEFFVVLSDVEDFFADPYPTALFCIDYNGNIVWKSDTLQNEFDFPRVDVSITNFNGDDTAEVFIQGKIYNAITGELIIDGPAHPSGGSGNPCYWRPCNFIAVDVLDSSSACPDCNGLELISGDTVWAVDIINKTILPRSFAPINIQRGYTSVADIDGDDSLDIIVSSGHFNGLSVAGSIELAVWNPRSKTQIGTTFQTTTDKSAAIANVGNLDSDSLLEIGIAGANFYHVIDYDPVGDTLIEKWKSPVKDGSSAATSSTIFDFDCNDGIKEVIYRDEERLRIYNGQSGLVEAFYPCVSGTGWEYPVIADVDGNKQANILCDCDDRLVVFESKIGSWGSVRKVWNQADYFAANINDDLTIPKVQQNHANPGLPILNSFLNQPNLADQFGNPSCYVSIADPTVFIDTGYLSAPSCETITVDVTVCNLIDQSRIDAGLLISFYDASPFSEGKLLFQDTLADYIYGSSCMSKTVEIPINEYIDWLHVYVNDDGSEPLMVPNLHQEDCDSSNNSDSIRLILPDFSITFPNDTLICFGKDISLNAFGSSGYFTWTSPQFPSFNETGLSVNLTPVTNSEVFVDFTDLLTQCVKKDSVSINVINLNIKILGDTLLYKNNCTELICDIKGEVYNWLDTDGNSVGNEMVLKVCPENTISYMLIMSDSNGCIDTANIQIEVLESGGLVVPKAFTPGSNGDINNIFVPISIENIKQIHFYIYNRWGELIYYTDELDTGWDGTYDGVEQNVDVYYYHIKALGEAGQEYILNGIVTLIR